MSKSTDRKVSGRYVMNKPRRVRFTTATGQRETLCLTDLVRDLLRSRIAENNFADSGVPWTSSELARQLGLAPSTLHGITKGEREPTLQHLERICALANSTVLEVLWATPPFISTPVMEKIRAGENPFADLRLRGNLTEGQIDRIGHVAELAAVSGNVPWLVELIEQAGKVLRELKEK